MTDPALARVVMNFAGAVVRHDGATAVGDGGSRRKSVPLLGGVPLLSFAAAIAADVVQLQPVYATTSIENPLAPLPSLNAA